MTAFPSTVRLAQGREKSVLRRHPWVFSGAVERLEGEPASGDTVRVVDPGGAFLAWGQFSPHSQIRIRLLEWEEKAFPDEAWWSARLAKAVERRAAISTEPGTDAYRLVHSEADLLPGLVADRYGDWIVLQALTAGTDRIKGDLAGILASLLGPQGVYERSDAEVRRLEGLPPAEGTLWGRPPPLDQVVRESGLAYRVDLHHGQKTGFYLDQRANRRRVAAWAPGRECLDAFSYAGGFAVPLLRAGASSCLLVDSSRPALDLARANLELNGVSPRAELLEQDVFRELRRLRDHGRRFDLVVLDPPKLAPTRAHAKAASRAYKDINLLALKLLRPEGILATFSCSGGVDEPFFREILSWAAKDSGREVQVLERLSQGPDHPSLLAFPESEYLKGFLCRAI